MAATVFLFTRATRKCSMAPPPRTNIITSTRTRPPTRAGMATQFAQSRTRRGRRPPSTTRTTSLAHALRKAALVPHVLTALRNLHCTEHRVGVRPRSRRLCLWNHRDARGHGGRAAVGHDLRRGWPRERHRLHGEQDRVHVQHPEKSCEILGRGLSKEYNLAMKSTAPRDSAVQALRKMHNNDQKANMPNDEGLSVLEICHSLDTMRCFGARETWGKGFRLIVEQVGGTCMGKRVPARRQAGGQHLHGEKGSGSSSSRSARQVPPT